MVVLGSGITTLASASRVLCVGRQRNGALVGGICSASLGSSSSRGGRAGLSWISLAPVVLSLGSGVDCSGLMAKLFSTSICPEALGVGVGVGVSALGVADSELTSIDGSPLGVARSIFVGVTCAEVEGVTFTSDVYGASYAKRLCWLRLSGGSIAGTSSAMGGSSEVRTLPSAPDAKKAECASSGVRGGDGELVSLVLLPPDGVREWSNDDPWVDRESVSCETPEVAVVAADLPDKPDVVAPLEVALGC